MYRKQEVCRNFQRGSCQYGARCKFLHTVPQQTESNPYGFGTKAASQAEANPYGFGVKAAPQAKGPVGFGAKNQNQKPFENKWNRFSPLNSASTTSSRQSESQQAATHTCTNPETCKYQIVEDYKSEQPLWKLTCYGHWKYLPCDITGDISYEELRAAAYDDSRKGLPLQLIVERERNLLKNKIAEFDSFLQKPYVSSQNHGPVAANLFSQAATNASPSGFPNNLPLPFGQVGPPINSGNVHSNFFVQPNPFGVSAQTSSAFNINSSTAGSFGSQGPNQAFGSSSFAAATPFPLISSASPFPVNGTNASSNGFPSSMQAPTNFSSSGSEDMTNVPKDMSIWLKEDWEVGEVPEDEPPPSVIQRV
ncbi:zinc finger CCCH domain-containing protein 16 isoform X2 [Nymphaea colorata]|uniref:zinc finger CCCH domain-containing protein 16 isoform X2 n=1 Tax=Nymphaea colorata TaxID=210225 RepID=UPI00129DC822|nr:zinc finger CCCH domain-containing protein 16 isoform X2 [Nymphaea colorata]